jgi:hypothetical protein
MLGPRYVGALNDSQEVVKEGRDLSGFAKCGVSLVSCPLMIAITRNSADSKDGR